MPAGTAMDTVTTMRTDASDALRLASWFSPAFPIGAFSYSHGIERAVEAGEIADETSLGHWIDLLLRFGSGRNEATLFACAYAAVDDADAFVEVAAEAAALRPSAELALESEALGAAFVRAVGAGWPARALDRAKRWLDDAAIPWTAPVAAGACSAIHGLPRPTATTFHLHAFASNLVSAGVRLVPLGQSAGLRVVASLEATLAAAAAAAAHARLDDLGGATPGAEIGSIQHETQYTRLFRS